MFVIKMNKKL